MAWRIGIDSGGTFTDICLFDESSGRIAVWKISSTPADPSQAVAEGRTDDALRILEEAAATARSSGQTAIADDVDATIQALEARRDRTLNRSGDRGGELRERSRAARIDDEHAGAQRRGTEAGERERRRDDPKCGAHGVVTPSCRRSWSRDVPRRGLDGAAE